VGCVVRAGRHPVARAELQPAGDAARVGGLQRGDQPNRHPLHRAGLPVAIWGFRPQDGFARSPYSNTGIQYGL
jgi:hypothetical protein